MSNKRALGWASAHVGNLVEDGISARQANLGEDEVVPVAVAWCEPFDAAFVVRFGGPDGESLYARITTELINEEGNPL